MQSMAKHTLKRKYEADENKTSKRNLLVTTETFLKNIESFKVITEPISRPWLVSELQKLHDV